jgi:hypothetical protein
LSSRASGTPCLQQFKSCSLPDTPPAACAGCLALPPAASLNAFNTALQLYRQRQDSVSRRNKARAAKRQQLLELEGQEGAAEAQALLDELGEDEEVPLVPAKLLNNSAVLKYRWVVLICGPGFFCWAPQSSFCMAWSDAGEGFVMVGYISDCERTGLCTCAVPGLTRCASPCCVLCAVLCCVLQGW